MLLHLTLIVFGAAMLALWFYIFEIGKDEVDRLLLAFALIIAGCGAILAGLLGLLIQIIAHTVAARKMPTLPPQPTTPSGHGLS